MSRHPSPYLPTLPAASRRAFGFLASPVTLAFVLAIILLLIPALGSLAGEETDGQANAPSPPKLDEAHRLVLQAEKLIDEGKFADARPLLERAEKLSPKWLRPKGLLGLVHQAAGERDKAIEYYAAMQQGILTGPQDQLKFIARCAAELMWLVNSERARRGIRLLKPHPLLSLVATYHAQDMRDLGFFSHTSPVPGRQSPADRFRQVFGFRPTAIAENIATRRSDTFALTLDNIRATHIQLMASAGHAHNILSTQYSDFGVGVAANRDGAYWVSEVFVRFLR